MSYINQWIFGIAVADVILGLVFLILICHQLYKNR